MRFTERKEFTYDPALFRRSDSQVALRQYHEYVTRFSAKPPPRFMEAARDQQQMDPLWHYPTTDRQVFSRTLDIPAINQFQKPDWKLTKLGIIPQRRDTFCLSNLSLAQFDYFPVRGDLVFWNGYRYMIINIVLPPEAYWQQTGVWLGLYVECIIPAEGDARPVLNPAEIVPAEVSPSKS